MCYIQWDFGLFFRSLFAFSINRLDSQPKWKVFVFCNSSWFLPMYLWVWVHVSFTSASAGPLIEKQEGSNNSFKEGKPDFQFQEKYCLDLCTWWILTDRKITLVCNLVWNPHSFWMLWSTNPYWCFKCERYAPWFLLSF